MPARIFSATWPHQPATFPVPSGTRVFDWSVQLQYTIGLIRGANSPLRHRQVSCKKGLRNANANVAQLVEQLIRNQQVAGSNPAVGSIYRTSRDAHQQKILCEAGHVIGHSTRANLKTIQNLREGLSLIHAIEDFIKTHNTDPKPMRWQKTSDEILGAITRFASQILQAQA